MLLKKLIFCGKTSIDTHVKMLLKKKQQKKKKKKKHKNKPDICCPRYVLLLSLLWYNLHSRPTEVQTFVFTYGFAYGGYFLHLLESVVLSILFYSQPSLDTTTKFAIMTI